MKTLFLNVQMLLSVTPFILQIHMNSYDNNSMWDLKFIDAVKQVKKYKCCPNDTFPKIVYTFGLTRHHGIKHVSYITPAVSKLSRARAQYETAVLV